MDKVRFGVIGMGNMGLPHARNIVNERSSEFSLGAICEVDQDKAKSVGEELSVPHFTDFAAMYEAGLIDAVIIAAPHYWHPVMTLAAARRGLHVMCEKPLAVTVGKARMMIEECRKHNVKLGAMLQQRTRPSMIRMKQMVDSGQVGEVFRVSMICSNWFRSQVYYDSGAWRGTWDGEGGGVLINQAPHSLDLFQWIGGGLPKRVLASVSTREHRIEVEDTANALCEYDKGKIGCIYATTAEEPGFEELMVCGNNGTLINREGTLRFGKLDVSLPDHIYKSTEGFGWQKCQWTDLEVAPAPEGHIEVLRRYVKWILHDQPPVATGEEAINELELSNAIYVGGFKNKAVELPVDAREIESLIAKLEKERSTGRGGGLRKKAEAYLRKLGVK
jgi:predicted dehydrogenase